MDETRLFNLLEKSLHYTPIVYKQTLYSTNQAQFDNKFVLEFKHTDLPDDSILFFVPSISSNDSADCKLIVRIPYVEGTTGKYKYSDTEYDIVVEENDLTMRKAKKGDLLAFRMCMFRFQKSSKRAILCNSPLYDDAIFNTLKVTDCQFINRPTFVDPGTGVTYTLVTTKEFNELIDRVEKLESRIIYGTEDAEEALKDRPSGTIYIKVEED